VYSPPASMASAAMAAGSGRSGVREQGRDCVRVQLASLYRMNVTYEETPIRRGLTTRDTSTPMEAAASQSYEE
jgi:hypothetical protein